MLKTFLSVLMLCFVLAAGGCAHNPVSGKSEFTLLSESDEIRLGRTNHAKIIDQYGQYDDPQLQAYVQKIGEQVAARSHRPGLIYRFTVLDSEEVNAFALPGGYIYITRGMLAYLGSEAELAAVLGHEAGHVTARHSVRQYTAQQTANLGLTLGGMFLPQLRTQGVGDLLNLLGGALLRGYGREHELEADRLGAEYLARSGYDPQAMIGVIRVLKDHELFEKQRARHEDRKANVYHGLFSTHPDNDTRLKEVIARANAFVKPNAPHRIGREKFLTRMDGLSFGQSARDGILRRNRFYHRDLNLGITFPAGWRVENRSDRLIAQPTTNDALLRVTLEDRNLRISPREFIRQRLKIKDLRNGQPIRAGKGAGDSPGYTGTLRLREGSDLRSARLTVLYYGKHAYVFLASARDEEKRRRYDPDFLATARSVRGLTRKEQALAKVQRLSLVRAKRGTGYAELAKRSPLLNYPAEQLRLLNGHYPKGRPRPGQWMKVVE